jgi:hypothetical protein
VLVDLATAKRHLREDGRPPDADQDADIMRRAAAAELLVAQWLNRNVYASQEALDAAIDALPVMLANANLAYYAQLADAGLLPFGLERTAAEEFAVGTYRTAHTKARATRAGVVVDDLIVAGILLVLGHLHENRQEVQSASATQIPMGCYHLLQAYRIGLGV